MKKRTTTLGESRCNCVICLFGAWLVARGQVASVIFAVPDAYLSGDHEIWASQRETSKIVCSAGTQAVGLAPLDHKVVVRRCWELQSNQREDAQNPSTIWIPPLIDRESGLSKWNSMSGYPHQDPRAWEPNDCKDKDVGSPHNLLDQTIGIVAKVWIGFRYLNSDRGGFRRVNKARYPISKDWSPGLILPYPRVSFAMAALQSKDDILGNEVVTMEPAKAQSTSQVNTTEVLKNEHTIQLKEVDEAAAFVAGLAGEVEPAAALRVRRKIDLHLLPLMWVRQSPSPLWAQVLNDICRMTLYFVQFTDKVTWKPSCSHWLRWFPPLPPGHSGIGQYHGSQSEYQKYIQKQEKKKKNRHINDWQSLQQDTHISQAEYR